MSRRGGHQVPIFTNTQDPGPQDAEAEAGFAQKNYELQGNIGTEENKNNGEEPGGTTPEVRKSELIEIPTRTSSTCFPIIW